MDNTTAQMRQLFEEYVKENEKFEKGNSAAGTRARKALAELGKVSKLRRNEISDVKNQRKEEKQATKK